MREKAKKNERRDTCRMMMNAECKRNKKNGKDSSSVCKMWHVNDNEPHRCSSSYGHGDDGPEKKSSQFSLMHMEYS